MPSRPRRVVLRSRAPRRASGAEWIPAAGPAPADHADPDEAAPGLTLSTSTDVEAARAALRHALLELDRSASSARADERDACECRAYARDEVQAAAGAYARALRREGVGLPAALLTVRLTVTQEAADRLPHAVYAAVQRDATQCCLEAFYPH